MARTFWVAVGAAGGIYAYRRGNRAIEDAKSRGLSENVQAAAGLAASAGSKAKRLAGAAEAALRSGRSNEPSATEPATINEMAGQHNAGQQNAGQHNTGRAAQPSTSPYTTTVQKTRRTSDQPENPWKATSNGLS